MTMSFSIFCLVQSKLILLTYSVSKAIGKNIKDFSIFAGFCFLVGKNLVSQDKQAGIRVELWFSEGRRPESERKVRERDQNYYYLALCAVLRVCRLHTAFLHWPLSSAATKEVQGPDTT